MGKNKQHESFNYKGEGGVATILIIGVRVRWNKVYYKEANIYALQRDRVPEDPISGPGPETDPELRLHIRFRKIIFN